ncbi:hypothetical protein ABH930_003158 [Kitasatospora sp. GAS204A]|uniref:DUF6629 family protein n=1 Tax=unclassified Kitasatospora TaxID=2633591 RepID=UPI002474CC48|nr:DUF6629 family protein [Kitasatospora sp. GAS204B]MDH6117481.1 hypothetical protein [Kitasatospora sp. GAS204B]
MCWSAEADLVTGTAVAGLGLLCLARVRRARDLPLAAVPLLLGVHQLTEAAVWLGVDGRISAGPALWARTAWVLIALPVLPALVPAGVWCALGPPSADASSIAAHRRRAGFALLGVTVAALLLAAVLTHPVTAEAHRHLLTFGTGIPYVPLLLTGYLLATVGALLASGDRLLRLLGWLVGGAAVVCALLWRLAFISTWCALAALVSVVLLRWIGSAGRGGARAVAER